MPTLNQIADALEAKRQDILEIFDIIRSAPEAVQENARGWLSFLDRATGYEPTVTIEGTIAELRAMHTSRHKLDSGLSCSSLPPREDQE